MKGLKGLLGKGEAGERRLGRWICVGDLAGGEREGWKEGERDGLDV